MTVAHKRNIHFSSYHNKKLLEEAEDARFQRELTAKQVMARMLGKDEFEVINDLKGRPVIVRRR
jgi:hypothetical protein